MKRILITTFLLLWLTAVNGLLFPRTCVTGVSAWPVVCCPLYNGSPCGNSYGRGDCRPTPAYRAEPAFNVLNDERDNFPLFFFNWTCQCRSTYWGSNCGGCFYGWTGPYCNTPYTSYRPNILNMSPSAVQSFLAKVHYCTTKIDPEYVIMSTGDRFRTRSFRFVSVSYYHVLTYAHYYATRDYNSGGQEIPFINYAHGSTNFLTWHTRFLLDSELQIKKCLNDITFAFPYYKWEDSRDCVICIDDYLGASDYNGRISIYNVLSEWRLICSMNYDQSVCLMEDCACERPKIIRTPGYRAVTLPTAANLDSCRNMTYIDSSPWNSNSQRSVRRCLEGYHNTAHVFFGGTMSQVSLSPGDLMFYLHHCNVQRLLNNIYVERGITPQDYPANYDVYGHEPTRNMCPFYQQPLRNMDMMQPDKNFGIVYQ